MMGFHRLICVTLPPLGRPRYVKGKELLLHWRDVAASASQPSSTLIPRIEDLWKLTWSPEARSKRINVLLIFKRELKSCGQNIIVSSAYCKWDTLMSPFPTSIPFHRFNEIAFWMTKFRVSTMRSNKKGERGSPCLSPHWSLKGGDGDPFMRIDAEADITHALIQPLHLVGNDIWKRTQSRKSQEILSKALWKSSFSIIAFVFWCLHDSINSAAMSASSRLSAFNKRGLSGAN